MKKTVSLLIALALTLPTLSAMADTFEGSVTEAATQAVVAPSEGIIEALTLETGQTVLAGDIIGSLRMTKVFSPCDGTVAAVHAEEGDKVDGTVLEISPVSLYTVTCTTQSYAKTAENALIHAGETLWIKCTADGSHRAVGHVTGISGSTYSVEVTGGELYVGETVYLYRDEAFSTDLLVGKGTVLTHDTEEITISGVLQRLRVEVGDTVSRGQWLCSVSAEEDTALVIPADGVVMSISGTVGSSVRADEAVATIAVGRRLRITVDADDATIFHRGDTWYYIRSDDPHETHQPCTVIRILTDETDASATVEFSCEDDTLPLGLTVTVTDEGR